jgi:hypothetical protein
MKISFLLIINILNIIVNYAETRDAGTIQAHVVRVDAITHRVTYFPNDTAFIQVTYIDSNISEFSSGIYKVDSQNRFTLVEKSIDLINIHFSFNDAKNRLVFVSNINKKIMDSRDSEAKNKNDSHSIQLFVKGIGPEDTGTILEFKKKCEFIRHHLKDNDTIYFNRNTKYIDLVFRGDRFTIKRKRNTSDFYCNIFSVSDHVLLYAQNTISYIPDSCVETIEVEKQQFISILCSLIKL